LQTYSQFGGGTGTEEDPYQLYTKEHIDSMVNQDTNGKYYVLMNDITDTITDKICSTLAGSFNGKGHNLIVNSGLSLFTSIMESGRLDSLSVSGIMHNFPPFCNANQGTINFCTNNLNDSSTISSGICRVNKLNGKIINCTNNLNFSSGNYLEIAGICSLSYGIIQNCINNGNITIQVTSGNFAGISVRGYGKILNCINNGSISQVGMGESVHIGGITRISMSTLIQNCINNGDISCKNAHCAGGISGDITQVKIVNCVNNGNINGTAINAGGIAAWLDRDSIVNCFNSGQVLTTSLINEPTGSGIANIQNDSSMVINCLNVGKCSEDGVVGSDEDILAVTNSTIQNNYYDKQMCLKKGFSRIENLEFICYDSINACEGKLTTQLVGTSPELQALLGDDWSYAEGRYPIPLGLENHPAAQLAATPMYLPYTDQDNYNTVDSVTCHFMLGTKNNVEWECSSPTVNLEETEDGLKGVLQSTGFVNLVASLGNYHKNIILNIKSVCEPNYKNEEIQKTQAIAYPNPTKDMLYFNQASAYEIYDLQGKLIMKSKKPQNFVNTSKLKSGIYLIKIGEEIMKFVVE